MNNIKETLNILYKVEDYLEYGRTELGKDVGELINKLQNELNNQLIYKTMNNINNIIDAHYNELEINDFDFYNDFNNNFNK